MPQSSSIRAIALFLILICVLYPVRASAQQGWAIVGNIETSHGELPDQRILVTLQFRGNTIATTFSDSEGKFSFSDLLANAYHILIDDEKFRPVDQLVEINPMLTAPTMVRINLTLREGRAAIAPAPGSNPNMVDSVEFTKHVPNAAVKEFNKGAKSEKDGRTEEAIKHYEKAVSLAPQFYAARNNLGSAYLSKSQFAAAQDQFEQVIQTNPSDAAAYFNLGNLNLLTQKYQDADQWLTQGLSKEPNSALGHFLLGSLYTRLGRAEAAETELQTSLRLDPKMLKAHLALVNLFLSRGRSADAAAELRAFLKASPNDPFAPKAREVLKRLENSSAKPQSN